MAGSMATAISYSSFSLSAIAARSQPRTQVLHSRSGGRVTRFHDDVAKGLRVDMEVMGIGRYCAARDGRISARSRGGAMAMSAVHRKMSGISSTDKDQRDSFSGTDAKGWVDESGTVNARLVAQVRSIAVAARDHAEMHAIIGVQRDNWNKLCHNTVVAATIAAAILAATSSASAAPASAGIAVAAFLLNAGTAGLMYLAGKMQPSQLAEEQRSAARLCKSLADEIEATLEIDPHLREDAELYLEDKLARLQAIDRAYPLPLIPDGLPKFPEVVLPSMVSPQVNSSAPEIAAPTTDSANGWTDAIATDLQRTAEKLKSADIEIYLAWARKKKWENLRLAIGAPILVSAAALLNLLECFGIGTHVYMSGVAAACSVLAMFAFSFAQGGQIGMIFEMYRNCAGSFADVDNMIQRAIRLPVTQREDGELMLLKIALQLGRQNQVPMVPPGDNTAGKVF